MSAAASLSKSELREAALARRDALPLEKRQAGAETLAARRFPLSLRPGVVVYGFWPMRTEIDPRPLMRALAAAGAQLALPVVEGRGRPLTMRRYAFGEQLKAGVWGIREPFDTASAVDPDVLLVPLAAFDCRGHRVGYGAGYYDMTINRLRGLKPVIAVGLAFAAQQVDRVPDMPHDERLDLVLTERETIDLRNPVDP